jgi:hypothetical protein
LLGDTRDVIDDRRFRAPSFQDGNSRAMLVQKVRKEARAGKGSPPGAMPAQGCAPPAASDICAIASSMVKLPDERYRTFKRSSKLVTVTAVELRKLLE